jgi:nicotinic acid phosphoribosyltransferase
MGVRPHIHMTVYSLGQIQWPQMVEKNERADHAPAGVRQDTADFQSAAQTAPPLFYCLLDHGGFPWCGLKRSDGLASV